MSTKSVNNESAWVKNLYQQLREKEGRVYADEEVWQLPQIDSHHRYYREWQLRKRSARRLIQYLQRKKGRLSILEAGCGNGWLSHQLASIPQSRVIGIDINTAELQQAIRVFSPVANLEFLYGDMRSEALSDMKADIIIFAACIQYFPSLPAIIEHSLKRLNRGGEIHLLDSPLYAPGETEAARIRTLDYYTELGFTGMADHYFHHSLADLTSFNYKILYQPSNFSFQLSTFKNPFPWVCIYNK